MLALCGQPLSELQDFIDLGGTKHTTYALRVNDGEWRIDEVFLIHLFALDNKVFQQAEKLKLAAIKGGVCADELIKRRANCIGKALQHLGA